MKVLGLKNIISGTFLDRPYYDSQFPNGDGDYSQAIMKAASESMVSPYIIASKIIQEQGVDGTSALISGTHPVYTGYYNFFNVGASLFNNINKEYEEFVLLKFL